MSKFTLFMLLAMVFLFIGCGDSSNGSEVEVPGPQREEQQRVNPPVPAAATYAITMQNDGNGTASASPNPAAQGVQVTISAMPNAAYEFKEWKVVSGTLSLSSATTSPATFTMPASAVTIMAGFALLEPNTPNLTLSPVSFSSVVFGYTQHAAQNITITNTSLDEEAVIAGITLTGTDAASFVLDGEGLITEVAENNGTAIFTVQPNDGLDAGTYKAIITVTYGGGVVPLGTKTATVDVIFVVGKANPDVTWPSGLTAVVGQTLSAITLPANVGTPGAFSWTAGGSTSVGSAGTRTHNVTFTPDDTVNYNVVTKDVSVVVGTIVNLTLGDPSTLTYTSPNYGSIKNLTPIDPATFTVTIGNFLNETDASGVALTFVNPSGLTAEKTSSVYSSGVMTYTVTVSFDNVTTTTLTGPLSVSISGITGVPAGYSYSGIAKSVTVSNIHDGLVSTNQILVSRGNIRNFNIFSTETSTMATRLIRHYKLTENILESDLRKDLGTANNWKAIGTYATPFTGSFDGQNFTITGLTIDNIYERYQGVFGATNGINVSIKNIGIVGGSIRGLASVGGLVGTVNGSTITSCYTTCSVSGASYLGGIVGYIFGPNAVISNCYATGDISGGDAVGGIVGWNFGNVVRNCYASGNVSGTGVGGETGVGGISGFLGAIEFCYATGDISGRNRGNPLGGIGIGSVKNCVALNRRITTDRPDIINFPLYYLGRVVTEPGTNNYARSDMDIRYGVNPDGSGGTPKAITSSTTSLDGLSITSTQWNNALWWQNTALFPPSEWEFRAGLPILRNMPQGVQNPVVRP